MTAEALTQWLASIERGGRLTPAEVIDAARDPASPGHACFEWDDSKAAHQHRLEQARGLLAKRVVIRTDSYSVMVPRYVRDPSAAHGEQAFISVRTVTREGLQQEALASEFARVGQMLERARELAKAFGLVDEVDDLVGRLNLLRAQLPAPEARQ